MQADTIKRLRELYEAATPGPWQSMNPYQWDSIIGDIDGPDDGDMHYEGVADITYDHARSRANAALISAAVNALPDLLAIAEGAEADRADARRYRWLRECDWFSGPLCVMRGPKRVVTSGFVLGADCPSRERLDAAIDAALAGAVTQGESNG